MDRERARRRGDSGDPSPCSEFESRNDRLFRLVLSTSFCSLVLRRFLPVQLLFCADVHATYPHGSGSSSSSSCDRWLSGGDSAYCSWSAVVFHPHHTPSPCQLAQHRPHPVAPPTCQGGSRARGFDPGEKPPPLSSRYSPFDRPHTTPAECTAYPPGCTAVTCTELSPLSHKVLARLSWPFTAVVASRLSCGRAAERSHDR
jgi:hypothetical protein